MLKCFFFFFLFPIIGNSMEIRDEISHLDPDLNSGGPTLILLRGGRVLKYSLKGLEDQDRLRRAIREKKLVRFSTRHDRTIQSFEVLPTSLDTHHEDFDDGLFYSPTILPSFEEASEIFKNLRRGSTSWSQCFNRAHIWAYETKKAYDLDSMKVFLFFTSRYIRRYDYEWWFHVSPYTLTKEEGEVKELILDFKFARSPLLLKNWTDLFIMNKASCPVVKKYSDYRQHQDREDCYLIKMSMFYLQPLDLSNLEETGAQKTNWNSHEIRRAYRNGFGVW